MPPDPNGRTKAVERRARWLVDTIAMGAQPPTRPASISTLHSGRSRAQLEVARHAARHEQLGELPQPLIELAVVLVAGLHGAGTLQPPLQRRLVRGEPG